MNNTCLIISSKTQYKYIDKIINAVNNMSIKPDILYYVLDRESYVGKKYCNIKIKELKCEYELIINDQYPDYCGRPSMHNDVDYFLTGYCRNVCIDKSIKIGITQFIFIDGDCVPEKDLIKDYINILNKITPTLAFGKRKEEMYKWNDQRCISDTNVNTIFKNEYNEIIDESLFIDSAVVWTCNVGMNISCINEIKKINNMCYGNNEVFSSLFYGTWGGEDGFLGLECLYASSIKVYSINTLYSGIRHIYHERPKNKYAHKEFIFYLEKKREELLKTMQYLNLCSNKYKFMKKKFIPAVRTNIKAS